MVSARMVLSGDGGFPDYRLSVINEGDTAGAVQAMVAHSVERIWCCWICQRLTTPEAGSSSPMPAASTAWMVG